MLTQQPDGEKTIRGVASAGRNTISSYPGSYIPKFRSLRVKTESTQIKEFADLRVSQTG